MLPEIISNNICSLVPNEIRNVLICEIIFNLNGEINSYKFFEAQIRSFKRFTYYEIENQKIKEPNILDSIESLKKLTNILLQNKAKRNALEIESTEPYINIDDAGIILDMGIPERLFAHQIQKPSIGRVIISDSLWFWCRCPLVK